MDILLGIRRKVTNLKQINDRWKRKKTKKAKRSAKRELVPAKAKGMPTFQRIFSSLSGAKNRTDLRLEQHKRQKQVKMKNTVGLLVITVITLTSAVVFLRFILHF
jgi:hypothetical protein